MASTSFTERREIRSYRSWFCFMDLRAGMFGRGLDANGEPVRCYAPGTEVAPPSDLRLT